MEGNEEWEKEDWRAIMRGISDAKDGSMHVYGFLCAGDWRAQIYTHTYTHIHTRGRAHIHTHVHIYTGETIVTWRAVILDTHT